MGKSTQPLVSILTAVYNGEAYLVECIESVLAQSYANWEYIINDNCSTDRTFEIATEYACLDNRIRVFRNDKFMPVIANHNTTLDRISPESKFCKFVQADDWIFPECLARMVEVAEAHPTIGLVSSYRLEDRWVKCDGLPWPSTFMPGRTAGRLATLGYAHPFGSLSTTLIRADLTRGEGPFLNENLYADTEAYYRILQSCDFGFVHQVLSYSRVHNKQYSSVAISRQTPELLMVIAVKQFGRSYLSEAEYKEHLSHVLDSYYRALGKHLLKLKRQEFWEFHRKGLAHAEFPFSWRRVAWGALLEIGRVGSEPLVALGRHLGLLRTARQRDKDISRLASALASGKARSR